MRDIVEFLSALEANNNKEWFDNNRETYQDVRVQFLQFTDLLIHEIRSFDPQVPYTDPKKCVFRIFRDMRFSKDKRPYKNNFGAFISRDGRKGGNPGYYLHIQPGASFVAGGLFMPDAPKLKAIRNDIFNNPDDLLEIIEDSEFKNSFTLFDGDNLKTAPKGFPKDFKHIDLLRHKSFAPLMPLRDEQLFSPDIFELIISAFKKITPLNHYLNNIIDHYTK
ncbi:MAG: DUF2461 domain-containing protein [Prolixibacteraceae bacterium]|jgi:uncharacterized protein (TIGR02453 family)|nr:DUF2461 domain-containing protein [Prolixibacteraceae bacterium]